MTCLEIARAVFPDASDEFLGWLLWNRTGYPSFFHGDPARSIYKNLSSYRRAEKSGIELCLFCDNKAETGEWECARCRRVLSS